MVPTGATSLGLVVIWPSVKDEDVKNGEVRGRVKSEGERGRGREAAGESHVGVGPPEAGV